LRIVHSLATCLSNIDGCRLATPFSLLCSKFRCHLTLCYSRNFIHPVTTNVPLRSKQKRNTQLTNISKLTNMSDADSQDNGTERATTITSGLGINMKSAVNASPKSGGFEHPRYPSKDPTGQYANGKSSCSNVKLYHSDVVIAYNRVASVFYVKPSIPSSSFQGQSNGSPVTSPPSSLENAYGGLELGFEPMGSSSHSGLPTLQATRIPHRSGGPSFPIAHQRPAYSPTYGSPQGPPTIPEYEYNRSLVASTALVPYNPNLSQVMTEESGSDGSAYSDENGENGKCTCSFFPSPTVTCSFPNIHFSSLPFLPST
jgi:hypothetical protein